MPYTIIKENSNCYKVGSSKHVQEIFSKKCKTKKEAQKQRIAIILNEMKKNKNKKSLSSYFI